ncbi:glucokinase [Halorhodospira halochloris]|uniref:glucokinase n=1 Tax=Halorhodospira halochloris TaxID=1052 RepID=UPI001EE88AFB|nr:ROK family protein [Halorhodospira halochloris]MCG5530852.1 glucokinase [Halorhodospira halochloris]
MTRYLLADIGGTHTRLAESEPGGRPVATERFNNSEFTDAAELFVTRAARHTREHPGQDLIVGAAVAGPVTAGRAQMTNIDWVVDADDLALATASQDAVVINDYQALARSLPELTSDDLAPINGAAESFPTISEPLAVLGPGTGLGVAGAMPSSSGWAVISGEGGHVALAAADDEEAQVLSYLRADLGHVSAESLLSGSGLERLHEALHGERLAAPQISKAADAQQSSALRTLDLFFRFLGTTAGNLALTLGARGGIYLAGGILAKLGPERVINSRLHERLVAKGRFADYLSPIPVYLIKDPDFAALLGLRAWLDDLVCASQGGR